jgi:hypothetical protein
MPLHPGPESAGSHHLRLPYTIIRSIIAAVVHMVWYTTN